MKTRKKYDTSKLSLVQFARLIGKPVPKLDRKDMMHYMYWLEKGKLYPSHQQTEEVFKKMGIKKNPGARWHRHEVDLWRELFREDKDLSDYSRGFYSGAIAAHQQSELGSRKFRMNPGALYHKIALRRARRLRDEYPEGHIMNAYYSGQELAEKRALDESEKLGMNPLAKWETPAMHRKIKRCVKTVSKRRGIRSPWAICKASVKRKKKNVPAVALMAVGGALGHMLYDFMKSASKSKPYFAETKSEALKLARNAAKYFDVKVRGTACDGGYKLNVISKAKSSRMKTIIKHIETTLKKQGFKPKTISDKFFTVIQADKNNILITHNGNVYLNGLKVKTLQTLLRRLKKKLKSNPPDGAVKIYDNILAIEAEKGYDSMWPNEKFRHDFKQDKGKAFVFGLPDGSLLIKGNKRLWKEFDYD
jgi:hypothetical protein